MKVVIDTNILISALIRDGIPERVLLLCLRRPDVDWLVTQAIIDEYLEVIRRPKFALPDMIVARWNELLVADTKMLQPNLPMDFPRDRKDAPFLACAASGSADYLITGDRDFTDAQRLVPARIISARGFAEEVMGG
uniref:Putative toxin-antitoxin system toxin component, PIN family n=1 Tax=Candidatus Kentrum sp. SD TaxID=2126332 RepID=A0A451BHT8_9GAMM|nr:MAG: putative toxin-antitoxin system toxin component, PIN family [Candidatus Kentron sp. SD]VFK42561.1 MAG: putative toxin-antitoxin system toxin component, PIN family [Candidatus Kentron sp. SD]VFK77847.1 MAG: putative toxin-antitoxin system toxin component, PIN family [Candidatus Kentron sp. SD]